MSPEEARTPAFIWAALPGGWRSTISASGRAISTVRSALPPSTTITSSAPASRPDRIAAGSDASSFSAAMITDTVIRPSREFRRAPAFPDALDGPGQQEGKDEQHGGNENVRLEKIGRAAEGGHDLPQVSEEEGDDCDGREDPQEGPPEVIREPDPRGPGAVVEDDEREPENAQVEDDRKDQRSGRRERRGGKSQHADPIGQDENGGPEGPRRADEMVDPRHQLFPSLRGEEEASEGSQEEHVARESRKEKEDGDFQEVYFMDGQTLLLRGMSLSYGTAKSKGRRDSSLTR